MMVPQAPWKLNMIMTFNRCSWCRTKDVNRMHLKQPSSQPCATQLHSDPSPRLLGDPRVAHSSPGPQQIHCDGPSCTCTQTIKKTLVWGCLDLQHVPGWRWTCQANKGTCRYRVKHYTCKIKAPASNPFHKVYLSCMILPKFRLACNKIELS